MPSMALLTWDDLSWPDFVAGLEGFRDHFSRAAQAPEHPPENSAAIIALLNKWACRLSTARAPGALESWLSVHAADLKKVEHLMINAPRLPDHADELGALHDSLIGHMRVHGVTNMADAAASKTLYIL